MSYFYTYVIVHPHFELFYIGCRKSKVHPTLDVKYQGSSKSLKKLRASVIKLGWEKHIIAEHASRKESLDFEYLLTDPTDLPSGCLNRCRGGIGWRELSDTARLVISQKAKNRQPPSPETRAKLSAASKRHRHSQETLEKMSKSQRNRKPLTLEQRAKISAAAKNRPPMSLEQRAKISAACKGFKHTPETKQMLSEKAKSRWNRRGSE